MVTVRDFLWGCLKGTHLRSFAMSVSKSLHNIIWRCTSQTAGAQPIGRRLSLCPQTLAYDERPYAALVCRFMVSTAVIHVITLSTIHVLTPKGWKAEFAWFRYLSHISTKLENKKLY